eukprot:6120250-Amphidinium_carterae.1
MGKGYAVEMTQHAHRRVLQKAGLMTPDERVQYRSPIPRGPKYQMLVIDDFGALSQDRKGCSCPQSVAMLDAALAQYDKVRLHVSDDKTVRGAKQATVLGAHVDGVRGEVRPIPMRVMCVAELTLQFLTLRVISRSILEELVGIWSSFLLHRRQFFSLLSAVYCEGSDFERGALFRMSAGCCEELLSLFEPKVYATDASPWGAGLTEGALDSNVVQELARHAEQKGAYCRLESDAAVYHAGLQDALFPLFQSGPRRNEEEEAEQDLESTSCLFDFLEISDGPSLS